MLSSTQVFLLLMAATFYVGAGIFVQSKKSKIVVLLLFLAAICMFSFSALLDPFLNVWDERFHALVAKNLMQHPLTPMLYNDPVLDTDYSGWHNAHIWLHKQPLFLWQMALSMKLFGTTYFAVRLPGILLSAFTVVALYRCGALLTHKIAGYFGAGLMLTSFYWIELVTGRNQLDQNDVAFLSYVSLSVWAFVEYRFSNKKYWLVGLGLFAGAAILCKWLAGLFVFGIWFLWILSSLKNLKQETSKFAFSLLITLAVALPWQLYAFSVYPTEYKREQAYNAIHIWEPVEGHGGAFSYYYDLISKHYGLGIHWLLFLFLALFVLFGNHKKLKLVLVLGFAAQFLFFSSVATKMPSFALLGWLIAMLALAQMLFLLHQLLLKIEFFQSRKSLLLCAIALALIPLRLSISSFEDQHKIPADTMNYQKYMVHNKELLESITLQSNQVLFNINGMHYVDAMFYLNNPVYKGLPTEAQILELKNKGREIAVLRGESDLPQYITKNKSITVIEGICYDID